MLKTGSQGPVDALAGLGKGFVGVVVTHFVLSILDIGFGFLANGRDHPDGPRQVVDRPRPSIGLGRVARHLGPDGQMTHRLGGHGPERRHHGLQPDLAVSVVISGHDENYPTTDPGLGSRRENLSGC
jgi:hypothetical protein